MTTKEETIAKLKELKENISWSSLDSDICDAINICIDYENETQDYSAEYIHSYIYDEDMLGEYIQYRLKEYGARIVAQDLAWLGDDSSYYYIDDTYGDVTNIDVDRLKEIIDEMIDALWDDKPSVTFNS